MSLSNNWQVLLDDTDSQILYTSPGWFVDISGSQDAIGDGGPTYIHTLHGTNVDGSLSFTFRGTQVTVWGTSSNVLGGRDNTIWECFVDDISIGGTQYFEHPKNNLRLCNSGRLKDGTHELTVNVTTAGQIFWLDCIGYIPSTSLSLESAIFLIDNTDPEITYDSSWSMPAYSMTRTLGSTVSFNFTGTGLSWSGLFPQGLSQSPSRGTYSIDGGSLVSFYLNGLPNGENSTQYNRLFFSASNLSAGPHTLQVMYQGNSQLTPLTLDYLYVTNTLSPSTTTPNAGLSTSTSTSTSTSITISSVPLNPMDSPSMPTRPVGAIVGGVVGGMSFIILILAFFFWYWWRHNRTCHGGTKPELEVTPYSYDTSSQSTVIAGYNPMLGSPETRGIIIQPDLSQLRFYKSNIPRPLQEGSYAPPSYTTSIA